MPTINHANMPDVTSTMVALNDAIQARVNVLDLLTKFEDTDLAISVDINVSTCDFTGNGTEVACHFDRWVLRELTADERTSIIMLLSASYGRVAARLERELLEKYEIDVSDIKKGVTA